MKEEDRAWRIRWDTNVRTMQAVLKSEFEDTIERYLKHAGHHGGLLSLEKREFDGTAQYYDVNGTMIVCVVHSKPPKPEGKYKHRPSYDPQKKATLFFEDGTKFAVITCKKIGNFLDDYAYAVSKIEEYREARKEIDRSNGYKHTIREAKRLLAVARHQARRTKEEFGVGPRNSHGMRLRAIFSGELTQGALKKITEFEEPKLWHHKFQRSDAFDLGERIKSERVIRADGSYFLKDYHSSGSTAITEYSARGIRISMMTIDADGNVTKSKDSEQLSPKQPVGRSHGWQRIKGGWPEAAARRDEQRFSFFEME